MKKEIQSRVHKSPSPLVSMLSQIKPFDALPSYVFKINFIIILPSMPVSSKWSLYVRTPKEIHKDW